MRRVLILLVLTCLGQAGTASAQLSPGPLQESHAQLEGLGKCTQCHGIGKGVQPGKCLACHALIRERREQGRGLHADARFGDCVDCHSDHQGRDFAMIHWPDGEAAFDHERAGFTLAGAHAELECRACHRASLIVARRELAAAGKDGARSYLGLGRDCLDCHADPHAATLGTDCLSCHGQEAWRPVSGFRHDGTRYPLRGRHAEVACVGCHPREEGAGTEARFVFSGLPFEDCASCHRDPHAARFPGRCASCHDERSWSRVDGAAFDHDLTRYPLRGRHAAVDCARCHAAGEPRRPLAHARCTDCHEDVHARQLRVSAGRRDCEDCHDLGGFSPARYTLARHDEEPNRFPLRGAHRAVPCRDCHAASAANPAGRFRFEDRDCEACHADPHGRALAFGGEARRCVNCHRVESWRLSRFDHATTDFPLEGRHAEFACRGCHAPLAGRPSGELQLSGLRGDCAACHEDPHRGQFQKAGASLTRCDRCHDSRDWLAARFDHGRDARFALDGAHAALACAACHRPEAEGGATRYRPLPTDCRSCHPDLAPRSEGGAP